MSTKQIIVIRRDLKMRRGKEIAQGSHASMAFITKRIQKNIENGVLVPVIKRKAEEEWLRSSFRKIVCKVPDLDALLQVAKKAEEAGLETHIVEDSGYTEFKGEKTVTAVAIGPDYNENIDPVTESLELY